MANIDALFQQAEENEKKELFLESERQVFFAFPRKLTEDQLKEMEETVKSFLERNNNGEGFIIFTLGYGNACKVIEKIVKDSLAFYREEPIHWERQKLGRKPLLEAINLSVQKAEVVFYFDDGLYTTRWLKNIIVDETIDNRVRFFLRHFKNKGEEDFVFIKKKMDELKAKMEASNTEEFYTKLKRELEELETLFPDLGA